MLSQFPARDNIKKEKKHNLCKTKSRRKVVCVTEHYANLSENDRFFSDFLSISKKKLCFWRLVACPPIHTHFKENNCNWGFIWVIFEYTRLFQDNFSIYSGDTFWREVTTDGFVYLQDAENWGSKWDWIKPSSFCLSIQNPWVISVIYIDWVIRRDIINSRSIPVSDYIRMTFTNPARKRHFQTLQRVRVCVSP